MRETTKALSDDDIIKVSLKAVNGWEQVGVGTGSGRALC